MTSPGEPYESLNLPMVRVVPLVALDEFLLGMPQGIDCLIAVATKLDPLVGGLGLLNVMNRSVGGTIGVPEIGMVDFITHGDGGYEHGRQ